MMCLVNKLFLALTVALLPINFALGADVPVYKDGLLTIPSVSTAEQVGKYQDATFKLTEQGLWQLLSVREIGVSIGLSSLRLVGAEKVDVVKTDTFPVQVFLRISGWIPGCWSMKINQRLENNRFDITLVSQLNIDPQIQFCLAATMFFTRTISLSVDDLPAGIYSYDVNGTKGTFELTTDNKYPGDYFGLNYN